MDKTLNLKSRAHLNDYDYLHKLNPKELEWLNKFHDEEYNAAVDKNPKKNRFNKTRKQVKARYNDNNRRNRDVSVRNIVVTLDKATKVEENHEDAMNTQLDLKLMGIIDDGGNKIRKRKVIF